MADQLDQLAVAKFSSKSLARCDVVVERTERYLGLFVEIVEQGDVAAQDFLVAVEFDADAVDLRGNVPELLGKAPQPRFRGREQAADEATSLERCGIESARLAQDVGQELARCPELPILRLGEDAVGELDNRTLGALAERDNA